MSFFDEPGTPRRPSAENRIPDPSNLPSLSKKRVAILVLLVLLSFVVCVGMMAGCKEYNRYQKRAEANNKVKVAKTKTRQVVAEIETTKARAQQRKQEAIGIRASQDEISRTLTGEYLQYLAIQAQKEAAARGNAQIYIPSGNQGIPMVRNVDPSTSKKGGE